MTAPSSRKRSHRRRRHREEQPSRPRRRWLPAVGAIALLAGAVGAYLYLRPRPAPVVVAEKSDVRSSVAQGGDSLEVIVTWQLRPGSTVSSADSNRVEVGFGEGHQVRSNTRSALTTIDTLHVPAPAAGMTIQGYSCVASQYLGRLSAERCTPWQYVRPAAEPAKAAAPAPERGRTGATVRGGRIVVHPAGLQVDPDIEGRCARWQRANPGRAVWIVVNKSAVPPCTGPNGKPVVAQFCAFIELPDGRRMKTTNSAGNAYCEELYADWARQRYS